MWAQIPRCMDGETVFIIGGGPSASGVHWSRLEGRSVIGCNMASLLLPSMVRVGVMVDQTFLNVFRNQLRAFVNTGRMLFYAPTPGRPVKPENRWLCHIKRTNGRKNWGISKDPTVVSYNKGCGGTAINLAYLMGAKEIVLLGFDCTTESGYNWHDSYSQYHAARKLVLPEQNYYVGVTMAMKAVSDDLKALGVPCWNATKEGTPFEYKPLEDILVGG